MDSKMIEKLDRRRFVTLLLQIVGFGIFFPGLIHDFWAPRESAAGSCIEGAAGIVVLIIMAIGAAMLFVAMICAVLDNRRIKRDTELRTALDNELVAQYSLRSHKWAYFAAIASTAVTMILSATCLPGMTVVLAGMVVIYVTILTLGIAQLVYLKS